MAMSQEELFEWAKENRKRLSGLFFKKLNLHSTDEREAVFMAGSPGAWKTEFIKRILAWSENSADFCVLDLDEIREMMPEYRWSRAEEYTKWAIKILEYLLDTCRENGYNFILDWTFTSRAVAKRNIESLLKRSYKLKVFYIHTQPYLAWAYTIVRWKDEGRCIPPNRFIKDYGLARDNVMWAKKEYWIETYVVRKWLDSEGKEILEELYVPWTHQELDTKIDEISKRFYNIGTGFDRWWYFGFTYWLSKVPFIWNALVRLVFNGLPRKQ